MDYKLYIILQYSSLIIIKNRLENISKFTANNYYNIMKIIIFVINNLYEKKEYYMRDYTKFFIFI